MGDLIKMPHSELHATIEVLDRLGVTPHDFEVLRKASSWSQATLARVHKTDASVWAALELEDVAVRAGLAPGELRMFAKEDLLRQFRQVALGYAEIKQIEHVINCDADPFVPNGWGVHEEDQLQNRVRGLLRWDLVKVKLYLSRHQKGGKWIKGYDLGKELAGKPVLNANPFDYLLKNPHLIPEEWKGKLVFFWGTVYRCAGGGLCVRFLYFYGGSWRWNWHGLHDVWHSNYLAVLLTS